MKDRDIFALAALQCVRGLNAAVLLPLLRMLGGARRVWEASAAELAAAGMERRTLAALGRYRAKHAAEPERIEALCEGQSVSLVAFGEAGYPELLAAIYQPPLVLYVRGSLPSDAECLGIVGARRFSRYGEGIAEKLGEELAASGFCVVSGAARGIDSAAHRGALRTGRTVAVLGCGVDIAYPAENRRLLADIVATGGAIVSEYAPGTPPLPAFFPARNRIISGLSKGIIVVEAAERSGSLITAQLALDEGRDVFAVPGSIYSPTSQGCHRLIQQGAKLVTSVRDVLEEYGREPAPRAPRKRKDADLSGEERALYQVLSYEHPLSIDEIITSLKDGDPARLSFLLLGLELKGLVIENESHGYLRAERE